MNRKVINISVLVLFSLLMNVYIAKTQNLTKIRINPSQAYGGNVSEYFEEIEYIPLETTKESLFGDVGKLIVTDSSYVIADNDTRSIFFFKLNGKFVKRVKWPNYTFPSLISYDSFNNSILVDYIDEKTGLVKEKGKYTIFGYSKAISKTEIYTRGIFLEPDYYIDFNDARISTLESVRDTTIYLVSIFKKNILYKQFLPVNPSKNPGFCYFSPRLSTNLQKYNVQDGSLLISIPIEHSIYRISKDTIDKVFDIGFPVGIEFPRDILKITNHKILDSLKNVPRSPNLIYNIDNIFLSKNRLFLKGESPLYVSNMNTGNPNYIFNFIYDTLSHRLVALERLNSDITSYYLPVFNFRGSLMTDGITFYKEHVFSHISSLDMFFSKEANRNKLPKYPPVLKNYFKTQNRKSNPVIVRMKLKE